MSYREAAGSSLMAEAARLRQAGSSGGESSSSSSAASMDAAALPNRHLAGLPVGSDVYYHLGLTEIDAPRYRDVRFVIMGGSSARMSRFAADLGAHLGEPSEKVGEDKRFSLFLVGSHTLVASHGMGCPSISILLHEVAKLLAASGAPRGAAGAVWIRIGTCGALGVDAGTVMLSTRALDGALRPFQTLYVLGKPVERPAPFDDGLRCELEALCEARGAAFRSGATMCCNDFYEEQGRVDGAICDYDEAGKMAFLKMAHAEHGVSNIEMESLQFGAFTHRVGARAAVLCVALLNRFDGDAVRLSPDELKEKEGVPTSVVQDFIKNRLALPGKDDSAEKEDA